MKDIAGLQRAYSQNKESKTKKFSGEGKKYEFDFMTTADLDPNDYTIRILPPHLEKAPKGWVRKDMHIVQKTLDVSSRVSCAKNWDKPCAFCDLLDAIKLTQAFSEVDDSIRSALVDLELKERYMLPITIFANERQESYIGGNGQTYPCTKLSPGEKELGKIWTVNAEVVSLHNALVKIITGDPQVTSEDEQGSYLILKKDKRYDVIKHPELSNTPLKRMELITKYPNLLKLQGKLVDVPAGEAMLASCWWWKHVVPTYVEY